MSVVVQHATGREVVTETDAELAYYRGEAATVGGYTIDGVEYPAKHDVDSGFDPAEHNLDEVREHLANSTPAEQTRVLDLEASSPHPRKSLVGEVVEVQDPVSGVPLVQYEVPEGTAVPVDPEDPPADVSAEGTEPSA